MYYEMIGFVQESAGDGPCEDCLPDFDPRTATFFIDFDGTLVEIAERPDAIDVPDDLPAILADLDNLTAGRVVIVTGRPVDAVCDFLGGFKGPVIGSHGAEERVGGALAGHPLIGSEVVQRLGDMTEAFAATHPGLICERKPASAVLHFRTAPEHEATAYQFLSMLEDSHEGFELHHSKMAYELRPSDISKDASMARIMALDGFSGTRPVFFGDDVTDEPAFAWVNDQDGGISVKVGSGDTSARYRMETPAAARASLKSLIEAARKE